MLCSQCGKTVIEESKFCNHCGVRIREEDNKETQLVVNNNTEIDLIDTTLQVKSKEVNKTGKRRIAIAIIAGIVLLGGSGGGYLYYLDRQQKEAEAATAKLNEYKENLGVAAVNIIGYSLIAGIICEQYSTVWKDSIDARYGITVNGKKAYDFNEAISYKREELSKTIKTLHEKKDETDKIMKLLNNPPAEYQKAYDALVQAYIVFTDYVSQADSPTGSLLTFNQKKNQLSSDIMKKFNEFKVLIPNMEDKQKEISNIIDI